MYINKVTLATQNIESQFDFYTKVLGIRFINKDSNGFTLSIGSTALWFIRSETPVLPFYHFAINIPENKFFEAKEWLMNRVPILKDTNGKDEFEFNSWEAHSCYFKDADGNICEMIARHKLPNKSETSFSSISLINISEIGIVVDDVPKFVHTTQSIIKTHVFHGDVNEEFTPLGDDNGLLIVVKRGRKWFPEGKDAATEAPLTLSISIRGGMNYKLEGPPYQFTSG